jgi:hypothetical protein
MSRRRRAGLIVLTLDELREKLGLPSDAEIRVVAQNLRTRRIEIVVEGPTLPLAHEGLELVVVRPEDI